MKPWDSSWFQFRRLVDYGPVILEPRYVMLTPSPEELLRDTYALINEIQIDWLRRDLENAT